nr:capsid protein [Duck astrovirus]
MVAAMADKVVVKKTTTVRKPRGRSRSRSRSRRRSRSRTRKTVRIMQPKPKSIMKKVSRESKKIKQLEKRTSGPKINDTFQTTVTIGRINGNPTDSLERQHKVFLNPTLLKNQDSGSSASPLSTRASQYGLWRIQQCQLTLTPLCGAANVVGSVIFLDLEQESGTASAESPDTIKARPHLEIPIGLKTTWKIPSKQLVGPRMGWWNMDTGDDPTNALGPAINLWCYLKTVLALQQTSSQPVPYSGGLYIVEARVRYQFSNYSPKPNLAVMRNQRIQPTPDGVKIKNDTDGSVILEVTDSQVRSVLEVDALPRNSQSKGAGDTFWSVSTAVVDLVAGAVPGWGWLLKGGWWVIRRIFGQAGSNQTISKYAIYASVEDAAKDQKIFATVTERSVDAAPLQLTQLNQPNVNQNSNLSYAAAPPQPEQLDYLPLRSAPFQNLPIFYEEPARPVSGDWQSNQLFLFGQPFASFISTTMSVMGTTTTRTTAHNRWLCLDYTDSGVFFQSRQWAQGVTQTARNLLRLLKTEVPAPFTTVGDDFTFPSNQIQLSQNDVKIMMVPSTMINAPSVSGTTAQSDHFAWLFFKLQEEKVVLYTAANSTPATPDNVPQVWIQKTISPGYMGSAAWQAGILYNRPATSEPDCADSEEEDDDISELSSLFEQNALEDEPDFKMKFEVQNSKHVEEEMKYWKHQCERLMLEKALTGTSKPLVRFEKSGQWVDTPSTSSGGHAE